MQSSNFFSTDQNEPHPIVKSTDIKFILSHAQPGSLFIFDIDDTIGRVSQTIGLDAWFRFRIQQYANEGHTDSQALANAIEVYNLAQLASREMVTVDQNNHIAELIQELKDKGVKVIGHTARNHVLTDKTLALLDSLGVQFSDNVLKDGSFTINNKVVEIKNGVIFCNGNDKGICFEQVVEQGHLLIDLSACSGVEFADDSDRNCNAMARSLTKLNVPKVNVWHYIFAETHLPFDEQHKARAAVQETWLLGKKVLLTDEEADHHLQSTAQGPGR